RLTRWDIIPSKFRELDDSNDLITHIEGAVITVQKKASTIINDNIWTSIKRKERTNYASVGVCGESRDSSNKQKVT
ncbi:MAG: hypothetical protein ACF787_03565, partial [Rhodopirellula sp. JB053]